MSIKSHDLVSADVRTRVDGVLGHVTLARPESLNALSLEMIRVIDRALREWEHDDRVAAVLIDGEGDRAFCAGGDVVAVYEALTATPPDFRAPERLWREQHALDVLVADYRKPVVTVLRGIVLGGGVGLGCHARHRVVTDTTRIGMPEVSLGLSPDVGALHLLSRSPGHLGEHVALTGSMFGAGVALAAGLADAAIPNHAVSGIALLLAAGGAPDEVIAELSVAAPERLPAGPGATLSETELAWIAECYDGEDARTIVDRLRSVGHPSAESAAQRILEASPLAVAVTLSVLRSEVVTDRWATFVQDVRRNVNFSRRPDLVHGIRAAVVDKDKYPVWQPRRPEDVLPEDVAHCLAPFGGPDLDVASILARP